ncbi:hypothetical protein [Pseudoduganella aquatica]|uniref:hypothetical protein n=1 Tax=Pseudoduganella aquatica TaxID=2660641 RepID=UPI001E5F1DB3|nr:hypothetical protein [Pseudoduganella aquatica]
MMHKTYTRAGAARLLPILLPLMLAACSSGGDDAPTVKVTELPAGVYAVSAGDAASPTAGRYYAAADGSRLLVLNAGTQLASAMYQRETDGKWKMTPAATSDTALDLLNSSAIPSNVLNAAAIARSYTVRLAAGGVAAFSVNASGDIVAGATSCKLSGKLAASALPQTLKLSLSTAGCGDLPAQSEGFLVADSDYAPAAFRLLTSGAAAPLDLWAYPE